MVITDQRHLREGVWVSVRVQCQKRASASLTTKRKRKSFAEKREMNQQSESLEKANQKQKFIIHMYHGMRNALKSLNVYRDHA